jgi:hypothetical protein
MVHGRKSELRSRPINQTAVNVQTHKYLNFKVLSFLFQSDSQFFRNMILLFLFGIEPIQIIREKEEFQDEKYNEKLDKDNKPKRPTDCHSFETV